MNEAGYILIFSPTALEDIEYFKKTGHKKILQKIERLLNELIIHPQTGTGKPEKLKFELSGYWSRRISKEHRLIYRIEGSKVFILSLRGHY